MEKLIDNLTDTPKEKEHDFYALSKTFRVFTFKKHRQAIDPLLFPDVTVIVRVKVLQTGFPH